MSIASRVSFEITTEHSTSVTSDPASFKNIVASPIEPCMNSFHHLHRFKIGLYIILRCPFSCPFNLHFLPCRESKKNKCPNQIPISIHETVSTNYKILMKPDTKCLISDPTESTIQKLNRLSYYRVSTMNETGSINS